MCEPLYVAPTISEGGQDAVAAANALIAENDRLAAMSHVAIDRLTDSLRGPPSPDALHNILAVIRNPYGFTEATVRTHRLAAADMLESLAAEVARLTRERDELLRLQERNEGRIKAIVNDQLLTDAECDAICWKFFTHVSSTDRSLVRAGYAAGRAQGIAETKREHDELMRGLDKVLRAYAVKLAKQRTAIARLVKEREVRK